MSDNSTPPGLGVGPSVFPTKKVYDTFDVTYTSVSGVSKPSEVVYYDSTMLEIVTVTITYDGSGDPVWNGVTLKNHEFNIFTAAFELVSSSSSSSSSPVTLGPSSQAALLLTDSTVTELTVGVGALGSRQLITLQCATSDIYVWFGDSGAGAPSLATVTTNGLTLFQNAKETYEAVANQPVYAVSVASAASVVLVERA